jgi:hypothetical protein
MVDIENVPLSPPCFWIVLILKDLHSTITKHLLKTNELGAFSGAQNGVVPKLGLNLGGPL